MWLSLRPPTSRPILPLPAKITFSKFENHGRLQQGLEIDFLARHGPHVPSRWAWPDVGWFGAGWPMLAAPASLAGVGIQVLGAITNDAKGNRMVTAGLVHAWRTRKRLPVAVLGMDDSSSTIRLASVADSRLRTIRDHGFERAGLVDISHLALEYGRGSSKVRVGHDTLAIQHLV